MMMKTTKPGIAAGVLLAGALCFSARGARAQNLASEPSGAVKVSIPDVVLKDQDGKSVRFYTDLVKGRVVAINFIFTSCTTICPPLGATFAGIQKLNPGRAGRDFSLISISVDPTNDTPERLKAWAARFGAGPGWTLVTGSNEEVTRLLSALRAGTSRPQDHTPLVLIGNDATGVWTRAYGLSAPEKLVEVIDGMIPAPPAAATAAPEAQKYFSDVVLIDQDGREVRFYSDLLKGRKVIISSFFTTCTTVCPVLNRSLARIQEALGDRVGRDVSILSISVDPEHDTPPRLKAYAESFAAKPGWRFLTGKKENVDWALYKLGQYVEAKEEHSTVFIVGDESTGVWKKVLALADNDEVLRVIRTVIDGEGK